MAMEQIFMVAMMRGQALKNCKLFLKQVKELVIENVILGKAEDTLIYQLSEQAEQLNINSHLLKKKRHPR